MKTTKKRIRKKAVSRPQPSGDETFVQEELREPVALREKKRKILRLASRKTLTYGAVLIAVFFLVLLVAIFFMEKPGPLPVTIDEYHDINLRGELDPKDGYLYNGFSFVKVRNTWYTRLKRENSTETYQLELRYGPRDVEEIPLTGDYLYHLSFNSTFITFDPQGKDFPHIALAAADLSTNLVRVFNITPHAACTQSDDKACLNRPLIQCTQGIPSIFIKEDPLSGVTAEGTCITLQGEGFNLVKAANRLLLAWYGIM